MDDVFVLTADVLSLEFTFDVDAEMPELADSGSEDEPVDETPAAPPVIEEPVWVSLEEVYAYANANSGTPFGAAAGIVALLMDEFSVA